MIQWEENPIPHYTRAMAWNQQVITVATMMGSTTVSCGGAGGSGSCSVVRHGPPEHGDFKAGDVYRDESGEHWHCVTGGNPGEWTMRPGDPAPWGKVIAAAYGDLCCPPDSTRMCRNRYCWEYRKALHAPPVEVWPPKLYPNALLCAPRPARPPKAARNRLPCSRQWLAWMVAVYAALCVLIPASAWWFGLAVVAAFLRDVLNPDR